MNPSPADRSNLFLEPPGTDRADQRRGVPDHSAAAMHQMRHPFRVEPSTPASGHCCRSTTTGPAAGANPRGTPVL